MGVTKVIPSAWRLLEVYTTISLHLTSLRGPRWMTRTIGSGWYRSGNAWYKFRVGPNHAFVIWGRAVQGELFGPPIKDRGINAGAGGTNTPILRLRHAPAWSWSSESWEWTTGAARGEVSPSLLVEERALRCGSGESQKTLGSDSGSIEC